MAIDDFVSLTGNLTRDPELRYTAGGVAKCSFGLAVNHRWQKDGEWQEATSFFNCYAWRDLAENIGGSLAKGDRVTVTGRLEQRSYEQAGEKRSVVEVEALDVGVSLRWATAKPQRTARGRDAGPAEPPSGSSPPSRPQGPPPAAETGGAWDDEEPF